MNFNSDNDSDMAEKEILDKVKIKKPEPKEGVVVEKKKLASSFKKKKS